ncbi:MAG: hypothetical protein RMH75_02085 [Archaeoglobaceae archaeon]|nr:hypothetical protein [Archaeoglobaceae archaeon]MDW7989446.1 hypothetical protein [Archaeoglobaceae archaeon]
MKIVFFILLILIIFSAKGCVLEIRNAIFYPNGTQIVTRDWFVVDFTNKYDYDLFDVQFSDLASLSIIRKGERVMIDPYKNITPIEFPILIKARVHQFENGKKIEYTISNYGDDTRFLIKIPAFSELIRCEGCEISDGSIFFDRKILKNESANFTLVTTQYFTIPDGEVNFFLRDELNLSFTANVPVSIEKGDTDNWIGIFNISNVLDREIVGKADAFVEYCDTSCNRSELFSESFLLKSGEVFSRRVEVQSTRVPIFIFKVEARVRDFCPLLILPAMELEGKYLIGSALLKGFDHKFPLYPEFGDFIEIEAPLPPIPPLPTPFTPTPSPTPIEIEVRTTPEVSIPFERVIERQLIQYMIIMLPSFFGSFIATVLIPIYSRRGVVALKEHERIVRILSHKMRIYTTPSSPLNGGKIVEPDEDIVSMLIANGLTREFAEAISVAIKVKKPLIVSDLKTANMALSLGVPVIFYGRT